ncbi:DNA translocase FtsK [Nicoletella semolina]|uniref:DNA translocase FtsK n=1 Tax=Nicoletella semolina TaxID=271160 RepID=A0A4R2NAQ9_9PAST|nr:DNA translocase FtsK 4TM domain-containing protein [Nicoletella semolina]MDH2924048.1 cell division protein FtsK [Nicoletella semolina]TCP18183.1 DNA translocase FtsK [Nicoletella semolina]
MIERLKGRENLLKLGLLLFGGFWLYILVAWISYSPLDNSWSVASSISPVVLNKAGYLGAWSVDLLLSMFGKVAFLVPFSLVFLSVYLLIFSQFMYLKRANSLRWLGSFVLLLLGLSILANHLLPHSPYYLAGGFIGGLLSSLIMPSLGLIGGLLIGILLTAIGFYFCSGQILFQLFMQLYRWVVEGKSLQSSAKQAVDLVENFVDEDRVDVDNSVVLVDVEKQNDVLTDVSQFIRPKITGLQPVSPATEIQMPANERVVDEIPNAETRIVRAVEQDLPKVLLEPENVDSLFTHSADLVIEQSNPTLPKVTLSENALHSSSIEQETVIPVELPIQREMRTIDLIEPKIVEPRFIEQAVIEQELGEETITSAVNATEKKARPQSTPVVHPLLQRKNIVLKPTSPMPTLDLLDTHPREQQQITEQEIRETSRKIEQELANFGVKATVEDVLVGPVVTRYEILPASGVKANKITNLDADLARALIFKAIRITDVVPGKPYMGIETPNNQRETVWLRDVLASEVFQRSEAILPMALGKDISGQPIVVDMAKMPHLLVAGQTGGGKSVGVNTMILSLLFKLTPEQVRFIMIDPKVVELSIYNDIPHLLTPVVTDMKKAENALRWAVEEMERRYQLVSYVQVRNIEGYNAKLEQAEAMNMPIKNPYWKPSDSMDLDAPALQKMSYIVLIVDEFADLMMSAGKRVEEHIMRIAQKARAVGIHLILATQRPSTDVITGVIKANIPSRIAFTVASQIDSRTILDKGGAEALLGRGDMLYSGAGSPEIIRIHGAFMSDEEVQRVADDWRARAKPEYIDSIVESSEDNSEQSDRGTGEDLDPLFDEIAQFISEGGATSISGIQRRFSIGFNRAARIIDQLEEEGILSAPDNRGKREVLVR